MTVTCKCIGMYSHALVKGEKYEVLAERNGNYQLLGNHGKRIWISKEFFVAGMFDVPILAKWKLEDDIDSLDFIEVTFAFSDGSRRWSIISTPDKLQNYFKRGNTFPHGINYQHLIIVKAIDIDELNVTFKYFDDQDELGKASLPLDMKDPN